MEDLIDLRSDHEYASLIMDAQDEGPRRPWYMRGRGGDLSLFDLSDQSTSRLKLAQAHDTVWRTIKPKLVSQIRRDKARAAATDAKAQLDSAGAMLQTLYGRILDLVHTVKLDDGPIPPSRVLYTISTFRSALVNLEGRSRPSLGDLSNDEIVTAIQAWRRRIALDLAKLVDSDATADTAGEMLQQVSAIFRCGGKCGTSGGVTLSSAHAHECLKRELAYPFPDADEPMLPSQWLDALPCEAIAIAVVDAVGYDPDTTRLADVEDRLFLLDVSADRRIVRNLRERISSQPYTFADLVRRGSSGAR